MKKSPATKAASELWRRLSAKTDRELVGIVYIKKEQYTPQAIEVAEAVIAERKLTEKTIKRHQRAVETSLKIKALREKKESESGSGIFSGILFEIFFLSIMEGIAKFIGGLFD